MISCNAKPACASEPTLGEQRYLRGLKRMEAALSGYLRREEDERKGGGRHGEHIPDVPIANRLQYGTVGYITRLQTKSS